MNIINNLSAAVKLEVLSQRAGEIISRLEQAGLFRAIVIEQRGNTVLLDTAFGKLSGKAMDNLHKGDEVLARVSAGKAEPSLKIEHHIAKLITFDPATTTKLASLITDKPVIAGVVSQQPHSTQIQINSNTLNLPKQNSLQLGETLLLQHGKNQSIEVSRLNPQMILKTALSKLLPKLQPATLGYSLSAMQNLSAEILSPDTAKLESRLKAMANQVLQNTTHVKPDTAKLESRLKAMANQILQNPINAKAGKTVVESSAGTTGQTSTSSPSTTQLKQLLTSLASPMARIESFKPESVQRILTLVSLFKPLTSGQEISAAKTVPESLRALMNEIKSSPDSFKLLINQIFQKQGDSGKAPHTERMLLEMGNHLRLELLQQSEQNLNQILIQKSAVKLQVETNQPIQIHLNIPIQVENQSRNVELKIREKQRNEQETEEHWEIDLTFEFGLLGQISTHILLQDSKLSAHFWAIKPMTKTLIDTHLDQFKNQLKKTGFKLGLFNCYHGTPPDQPVQKPVNINENLVDIKV